MKESIRINLYPLLFMYLISMCFLPCVQADEPITVTVDGVSTIIGEDRARARDEALRDAYRMALEKAGVNISAYTEMVDLVVIKDVVRANVEGYVKSWQIDGEWKDGNKHGQGTYTSADGDKYVGEWKDDNMHGQGTLTWANGNKYVGEWKDDNKRGQGTYTYADGEKYVGEWKDGNMHGQGTYTSANGDKYVGEWKDDKEHGQGTRTWAVGDKYVGEWKDGDWHGQGTYTRSDGRKYVGEWRDGKRYDSGPDVSDNYIWTGESGADEFASKNGIKTWLTIDELTGNPFVYEGKIIGVDVYFVKMVTATSGIFRPGGFYGAKHIVVSKIPKGLFRTSDARIILAGKVLGNTESILPLLGSVQVPHLKFIDYMLPK